jgi:hypothetical protein
MEGTTQNCLKPGSVRFCMCVCVSLGKITTAAASAATAAVEKWQGEMNERLNGMRGEMSGDLKSLEARVTTTLNSTLTTTLTTALEPVLHTLQNLQSDVKHVEKRQSEQEAADKQREASVSHALRGPHRLEYAFRL